MPLIFGDFPIVGKIEILTAAEAPKKGTFWLEDNFVLREDGRFHPRYFPTRYAIHDNVFGAIRESYLDAMLPADSQLYAVVNGIVMGGKTKKVKPFENLEEFVNAVETVGDVAVVVSYRRRDFEELAKITEERTFWGTATTIKDLEYVIHTYNKALRKPPKYKRIR